MPTRIRNKKALLRAGTCKKGRLLVLGALEEALRAAVPEAAVRSTVRLSGKTLRIKNERISLEDVGSIYVIGGGKVSGHMAEALFDILGDRITSGLVIVPDYLNIRLNTGSIKLWKGTHPIPSQEGMRGVKKMLDLVRDARRRDLVICLISGGGSALMPLPYGDLTVREKQGITSLLLKCGATIQEVNCVRKHLSAIKGGRLAELLQRPRKVSLIISDVVGDRLDTIASGPMVPDRTTFGEALYVLKKYAIWRSLDPTAKKIIGMGAAGKIPETPKPGSRIFRNAKNILIANNSSACESARNYLKAKGIRALILTTILQGEAVDVGTAVSNMASEINLTGRPASRPAAAIMGGETTVRVRGKGRGGRNQELVLSACRDIRGLHNTVVASMGTDGIDGNSDAAGAIADSLTPQRASRLDLDPNGFLLRNDSNTFFRRMGDTIQTGMTGTNVNDIVILLCL